MSYVADGGTTATDVTVTAATPSVAYVSDYGINYADISVTGTAYFVIGALSKPDKVSINQRFTITVTVVNNGGETGDVTIRLYENDSLVATQTITLAPGTSQEVSFERLAPPEPTTLNYKVELFNNVTNEIDDQATFTVQVVSPSTGGVGSTAFIGLIILVVILMILLAKRK